MKLKLTILGLAGAMFMAGCGTTTYGPDGSYATKECINELAKGAEIDQSSKIDKIVVYKKKRKMYAYRSGKLVGEYRISLGKNGDKGDKIQMGDYRTPEGCYRIVRKKCDPRLFRSLMISYPDPQDIADARARGVKPGGYITIHGQPKWNADGRGDSYTLSKDWTEGCMAVTNRDMETLWRAVQNGVKIEIHA
ncbi:MAG: hypothetical protein RL113_625 [Pseudomonadota bacterium]